MHLAGGAMPPARERALPGGQVHLMVNLHEDEFRTYADRGAEPHRTRGVVRAGPHARATVIDTAEQRLVLCVDFRDRGTAALFGGALGEARDQLVDLERLWGRDGSVLRESLLAAATPGAKFAIIEAVPRVHLSRAGGGGRDPVPVAAGRRVPRPRGAMAAAPRLARRSPAAPATTRAASAARSAGPCPRRASPPPASR
jgi:hypothetical protein